jgi:hypothetical protein
VPIVADIHFHVEMALAALEAGVHGLRLNPGNLRKPEEIKLVAREAKDRGVPIRIGVNAGSLHPDLYERFGGATPEALVESARMELAYFQEVGFDDVKISVKASSVATMIAAYRLASETFDYPLHLGVTEAGPLPGGLLKGTAGIGTPHHLSAELLKSMTGIEMTHVPYKGAAQLVPALLGNEVTVTVAAINTLLPHMRSGKLRALAVSADHPFDVLPDVPTIADAGGLPGFSIDVWLGVLAPAGTPRPIIDHLNFEVRKALAEPDMKKRFADLGGEARGGSPEEMRDYIETEIAKWKKLIEVRKIEKQ